MILVNRMSANPVREIFESQIFHSATLSQRKALVNQIILFVFIRLSILDKFYHCIFCRKNN
jgi:hypothetical protein